MSAKCQKQAFELCQFSARARSRRSGAVPSRRCEEKTWNFFTLFQPEQRYCAPPRMISLRDKHQAETQRSID